MAKDCAKDAGLDKSPRLRDPTDPFYRDWTGLAVNSCTFY